MSKHVIGLLFALVITGAVVGSARVLGWIDGGPTGTLLSILIGGVISGIVARLIVGGKE